MADTQVLPSLQRGVRPPAVPLITHSPYFSVWSPSDELTGSWTRHWTGTNHGMAGLVRIDGQPFRFMGREPKNVPAMEQVDLQVHATRTVYTFRAAGVALEVEFMSPLLMDDLELLSQPITYVTLTAHSTDGQAHEVEAYLDTTAEFAVDSSDQPVTGARHRLRGVQALSFRSTEQGVLKRKGDNLRIDWGTLYLAAPNLKGTDTGIGEQNLVRGAFVTDGSLPASDDLRFPRPAGDGWPVLAATVSFGRIGADPTARHLFLAYDEEFALEYFHRKLPPYWRRNGAHAGEILEAAAQNVDAIRAHCAAFDAQLEADLTERGGAAFAQLGALAYRQSISAHGLAEDLDGTLLMMSKENFSNGCIATVDVTYPGAPLYLHYNPKLVRAMIEPVLDYAASPRWRFPFAPHDLGTYPLANGQVYGGGERTEDDQMPVEECGNMLLLVAALNDLQLIDKHWDTLTKWADYLLEKGLDPENQLCTDDFAGHFAHNANLSLKAILALGAYAEMCKRQNGPRAVDVRAAAEGMAAQWLEMATEGDHTRLAFDREGTWSQKYNLVWDRLLGLNLFPASLAQSEVAYYLTKQNEYGLPLDNRKDYTKLDWIVWSATLAERREDFEALIAPVLHFANQSSSRVPLTDWYDTVTGKKEGFQARSVVGGVFLPMLKPR
ncbi:MAG: glutaminase domain-containing protein [Fimbriimonas sp.]